MKNCLHYRGQSLEKIVSVKTYDTGPNSTSYKEVIKEELLTVTPYIGSYSGVVGFGVLFRGGEPGYTTYQEFIASESNKILTSFRALQLLELVPEIDNGTVYACYYAANKNLHSSHQEDVEKIKKLIGKNEYERIMSSIPDELIGVLMMFEENGVPYDKQEILNEINNGKIPQTRLIKKYHLMYVQDSDISDTEIDSKMELENLTKIGGITYLSIFTSPHGFRLENFKRIPHEKRFKPKKIIGVLGGMSPEASANFYQQLIKECRIQYGAQYDEEFPEIWIYNHPTPNMFDDVVDLESPDEILNGLKVGIKKLELVGSDLIVMPCNTVHYFFNELSEFSSVPLLSITYETAKKISRKGFATVGLLGTTTTINQHIYDDDLTREGIVYVSPEEQEPITEIIDHILTGVKTDDDKNTLYAAMDDLIKKGSEAIVLACTELGLLFKKEDSGNVLVKVLDSSRILAKAAIEYSLQNGI